MPEKVAAVTAIGQMITSVIATGVAVWAVVVATNQEKISMQQIELGRAQIDATYSSLTYDKQVEAISEILAHTSELRTYLNKVRSTFGGSRVENEEMTTLEAQISQAAEAATKAQQAVDKLDIIVPNLRGDGAYSMASTSTSISKLRTALRDIIDYSQNVSYSAAHGLNGIHSSSISSYEPGHRNLTTEFPGDFAAAVTADLDQSATTVIAGASAILQNGRKIESGADMEKAVTARN